MVFSFRRSFQFLVLILLPAKMMSKNRNRRRLARWLWCICSVSTVWGKFNGMLLSARVDISYKFKQEKRRSTVVGRVEHFYCLAWRHKRRKEFCYRWNFIISETRSLCAHRTFWTKEKLLVLSETLSSTSCNSRWFCFFIEREFSFCCLRLSSLIFSISFASPSYSSAFLSLKVLLDEHKQLVSSKTF